MAMLKVDTCGARSRNPSIRVADGANRTCASGKDEVQERGLQGNSTSRWTKLAGFFKSSRSCEFGRLLSVKAFLRFKNPGYLGKLRLFGRSGLHYCLRKS